MKSTTNPEIRFASNLKSRKLDAEMAKLIGQKDWSQTAFGPSAKWPLSLRTALNICLGSHFPAALWWGSELLILYNDEYRNLLAESHPMALGQPEFASSTELSEFMYPRVASVLKNGHGASAEDVKFVLNRNGFSEECFFTFSFSPLCDDSGKTCGVFAALTETTERVLQHRQQLKTQSQTDLESVVLERTSELMRSRAFLDLLLENIPNMVFVKDAKELRFVRFNKVGEELLGVSREELIGKNDYDFFPKEQADHFIANDRAVLSGSRIIDIPEEPIATRHNGIRTLHTKKIPIFGKDGSPEYLLGISEDITEIKLAEEQRLKMSREQAALEERERASQRTALLAEASAALAASLNYHETFQKLTQLVVPALADWCTVTIQLENDVFKRVAVAHSDPKKLALIDELSTYYPAHGDPNTGTGDIIRTGKTRVTEIVPEEYLKRAAKDQRHLEIMLELGTYSCILVPIPGREKIHGSIALVMGESRRVYQKEDVAIAEELGRRAGTAIDNALLYDAAQKAVRARDEFLSIASHELKTPLTSIKLQAQMRKKNILRKNTAAFTMERLLKMSESDERQVNRLTRLIDDMLDISRIGSGKLSIKTERVDLCLLVQELTERFSEELSLAGCILSFDLCSNAEGNWDRFRIEQVVTNLLTNAMKYGEGKPIDISISTNQTSATLKVRDHGMGIAKKDQDRVFLQFERAVHPGGVSGLGLGLFIVKQILSLHNGSITVESEPGLGSTFTVVLPL